MSSDVKSKSLAKQLDRELIGVRNGNSEVAAFFLHGWGEDKSGRPRPDGRFVKEAIEAKKRSAVLPGQTGVITLQLKRPAFAAVTKLEEGDVVTWGINPRHRAQNPGVSPFLVHDGSRTEQSPILTFYFLKGKLIRAHVGEQYPPLPWQNQIKELSEFGLGDQEVAIDYWSTHAFLFGEARWEREGMEASEAPSWLRSA